MKRKKMSQTAGDIFEAKFLVHCLAVAKQTGLSKRELARRVFNGKDDPYRSLYACFGKTQSGRARRITLAEAYMMARAIEVDFTRLIVQVELEPEPTLDELRGQFDDDV